MITDNTFSIEQDKTNGKQIIMATEFSQADYSKIGEPVSGV